VTIGAGALPFPTKHPPKLRDATTNATARASFLIVYSSRVFTVQSQTDALSKRTKRGCALVRKSHTAHEFQHVARELGRGINPPLQDIEIPSENAPYELAPGSLRLPHQIFAVVGCALTSIALPPLIAARKNSARLSAAAGASNASTCRHSCGSDRLFRCFV